MSALNGVQLVQNKMMREDDYKTKILQTMGKE